MATSGPLTVVDSSGNNQTVYFSRPVPQYIWIKHHARRRLLGDLSRQRRGAHQERDRELGARARALHVCGDSHSSAARVKIYALNAPILSIPGIESATVTIAVTSTPVAPGGYGSSDIALTTEQQAVFAVSQILVNGS